jgi:hypothetical protein
MYIHPRFSVKRIRCGPDLNKATTTSEASLNPPIHHTENGILFLFFITFLLTPLPLKLLTNASFDFLT